MPVQRLLPPIYQELHPSRLATPGAQPDPPDDAQRLRHPRHRPRPAHQPQTVSAVLRAEALLNIGWMAVNHIDFNWFFRIAANAAPVPVFLQEFINMVWG
jgi:hypothetical protein